MKGFKKKAHKVTWQPLKRVNPWAPAQINKWKQTAARIQTVNCSKSWEISLYPCFIVIICHGNEKQPSVITVSHSLWARDENWRSDSNRPTMGRSTTLKPCSSVTEWNHFQACHSGARFVAFPFELCEEKKKKLRKKKNTLATHTLECSFPLSAALFIAMLRFGALVSFFYLCWPDGNIFLFSKAVINRGWKESLFRKISTQERQQWKVTSK